MKELQKTVTLGTAHSAESTNVTVQNRFSMRNNITCSTNRKYTTAATLYTQETWFVLSR